jgi:hypothetical protein
MQENPTSINQLSTEQIDAYFGLSDTPVEGFSDNELLKLFMGNRSKGYIEPFKKAWIKSNKNLGLALNDLGIHWWCFFFPTIVLGYRKQYFWLFIYSIIPILVGIVSAIVNTDLSLLAGGVNIAVATVFKHFYIQETFKKILAIKKEHQNDELIIGIIKQKGGTSWIGALIGAVIMLFYVQKNIAFNHPHAK